MEANPEKLQVVAKVIKNGRVTLPLYVRETLDIKDGDKVLLDVRKLIG